MSGSEANPVDEVRGPEDLKMESDPAGQFKKSESSGGREPREPFGKDAALRHRRKNPARDTNRALQKERTTERVEAWGKVEERRSEEGEVVPDV